VLTDCADVTTVVFIQPDSIKGSWDYSHKDDTRDLSHGGKCDLLVKLFRSQRNLYISGGCLLLFLYVEQN